MHHILRKPVKKSAPIAVYVPEGNGHPISEGTWHVGDRALGLAGKCRLAFWSCGVQKQTGRWEGGSIKISNRIRSYMWDGSEGSDFLETWFFFFGAW